MDPLVVGTTEEADLEQIKEVSLLLASVHSPEVDPQDRVRRLMSSIPCTGSALRSGHKVTIQRDFSRVDHLDRKECMIQ